MTPEHRDPSLMVTPDISVALLMKVIPSDDSLIEPILVTASTVT